MAAGVVAVTAVGVTGTLLYRVPVVGLLTGFVAPVMTWVVIVALLGGLLALTIAIWRRSRIAIAIVLVAALTVVGGGYVVARQVGAAEAAGAHVSLLQTLRVFGADAAPPDATDTFSVADGKPLRVSVFRPAPGRPAPVLMFIHGGGWVAGDRFAHASDLRWFADQGWLVFSVDYALSARARNLWDVVDAQIGCAMVWVAANAGRYGGDPSRLSLTGDSAGGNLAINAAYSSATGTQRSSCGGVPPRAGAVATLYPAVDPASVFTNSDVLLSETARGFALAYLGGSPDEVPERYAAVASITHVSPAAPPTLIVLGAADHLVPTSGAYEFTRRAREAGVQVRTVSIPFADHVFDGRPGSIGQQTFRQLTASWLREHGQGPQSPVG